MKTTSFLIAALIASMFCCSAQAQEQPKPAKTPRVAHRQINQQARIKQGVQTGELTKGETIRLEKEQAKSHTARTPAHEERAE
jgi:hypothetical protein